jgi:hypothetical protein
MKGDYACPEKNGRAANDVTKEFSSLCLIMGRKGTISRSSFGPVTAQDAGFVCVSTKGKSVSASLFAAHCPVETHSEIDSRF